MLKKLWLPAVIGVCLLFSGTTVRATQMEIYGAWHCGNDFCTWATVRDMANFDNANHWMIDRGDGTPSVNLVVLSFVNPLKLLNQTNDSQTVNGAPMGMNSAVVSYFTSHNIRVMLSIGGITYTGDWDTALSTNGAQLGTNAANLAKRHQCIPRDSSLRRHGSQSCGAVDDRSSGRRPIFGAAGRKGDDRLVEHQRTGSGLCERDGAEQAAEQRVQR